MPYSQASSRPALCRVGLAILLVAACCARLSAQELRRLAQLQPQSVPTIEPVLQDENQPPGATEYRGTPRYEEPAPPPFDFWQPTWMPCQSLRTNRSVVLGHLYWGADILGWSTKGVHVPALITSSSPASGAIIGAGDTVVTFGDEFQHSNMRAGGRLTVGWWFDPNQYAGIEWHYFELDGQNIRFHDAVANGNRFIGRPIVINGMEDVNLTASDTRLNSTIDAASDFQLTNTGILVRDLLWADQTARIDYLAGYRHTHLFDRIRTDESFTVDSDTEFDSGDGDHIKRVDQFRTINQFDGADLGLKLWWSPTGTLAFTTTSKFSIGAANNTVLINGYTKQFNLDAKGKETDVTVTNGGVLALPGTNHTYIRRTQQHFSTITELSPSLSWQPGCFWKFNLGYTWFYWSQVARAGDQIDRSGTTNQNFHLQRTSFWAQGLNGGFSYQF